MLKKYAVTLVKTSAVQVPDGASRRVLRAIAKRHHFDFTPKAGYLYVRSRAISSRTNDNYDEFPAEEIKDAYKTFIGKPVFVNHVNDNHRRARGIMLDAVLHEDRLADGAPDTWAEVLMEIDAKSFPKLAKAILEGRIDRTSMGCDVAYSICSACGNKATTPAEYCQHIPRLKGKKISRRNQETGEVETHLIRETCYGLKFFENSVLVEEPADPTAFFTGVEDYSRGDFAKAASRTDSTFNQAWSAIPTDPLDYSQCTSRRDNPTFCNWHKTDHLETDGEPRTDIDGHGKPMGSHTLSLPECDLCDGHHDSLHHYDSEMQGGHHEDESALDGIPLDDPEAGKDTGPAGGAMFGGPGYRYVNSWDREGWDKKHSLLQHFGGMDDLNYEVPDAPKFHSGIHRMLRQHLGDHHGYTGGRLDDALDRLARKPEAHPEKQDLMNTMKGLSHSFERLDNMHRLHLAEHGGDLNNTFTHDSGSYPPHDHSHPADPFRAQVRDGNWYEQQGGQQLHGDGVSPVHYRHPYEQGINPPRSTPGYGDVGQETSYVRDWLHPDRTDEQPNRLITKRDSDITDEDYDKPGTEHLRTRDDLHRVADGGDLDRLDTCPHTYPDTHSARSYPGEGEASKCPDCGNEIALHATVRPSEVGKPTQGFYERRGKDFLNRETKPVAPLMQSLNVLAHFDEDDEEEYDDSGEHDNLGNYHHCPRCGQYADRTTGYHPGEADQDNPEGRCSKPTLEDVEQAHYNSSHPADYCDDDCRWNHAEDRARGIGVHHTFNADEGQDGSISAGPHSEPVSRQSGEYEVRKPGDQGLCHYCRKPLVDTGMTSLGLLTQHFAERHIPGEAGIVHGDDPDAIHLPHSARNNTRGACGRPVRSPEHVDSDVNFATCADCMTHHDMASEGPMDELHDQLGSQGFEDADWLLSQNEGREGSGPTKYSKKDEGPSVSGVVLKAKDTGRILMLQRSMKDEKDPAAGTWEFPGGHHEDGDKTSLHAGIREWEEEVGQPFPEGGVVSHTWRSPNGIYQGHVVVIPEEAAVTLHDGRVVPNPDDPDGDDAEQAAWWDPKHAQENPALRREVKKAPWNALSKAAAYLDVGTRDRTPPKGVDAHTVWPVKVWTRDRATGQRNGHFQSKEGGDTLNLCSRHLTELRGEVMDHNTNNLDHPHTAEVQAGFEPLDDAACDSCADEGHHTAAAHPTKMDYLNESAYPGIRDSLKSVSDLPNHPQAESLESYGIHQGKDVIASGDYDRSKFDSFHHEVVDEPLANIRYKAGQSHVIHPFVEHLAKQPKEAFEQDEEDLPFAQRMPDGSALLMEGHHRAAAASLRGDSTVKMHVYGKWSDGPGHTAKKHHHRTHHHHKHKASHPMHVPGRGWLGGWGGMGFFGGNRGYCCPNDSCRGVDTLEGASGVADSGGDGGDGGSVGGGGDGGGAAAVRVASIFKRADETCSECGKPKDHLHIQVSPDMRDLMQHLHEQGQRENEMHEHGQQRVVDTDNYDDVKQHLIEAHGYDEGDFHRNSHDEGHPALDLAGGDDRPLHDHEVGRLHDWEHGHGIGNDHPDYDGGLPGQFWESQHFHTAVRKTGAQQMPINRIRWADYGEYDNPDDPPSDIAVDKVEHLKDLHLQGTRLDPVLVSRGTAFHHSGDYDLEDGWHRIQAHRELGLDSVPVAVVHPGHGDGRSCEPHCSDPKYAVRKQATWIGDHPDEPTLYWRAPQSKKWEVHVHNSTPSRDLREGYGAKPEQEVALLHADNKVEPHPDNAGRVDLANRGAWRVHRDPQSLALSYTPNTWGGRPIGEHRPPAHVENQIHNAFNEVAKHAEDHANLYGGLADHQDMQDDFARAERDHADEGKGRAMFRNLLNAAGESTCPKCDGEGNTEHGPKTCIACDGTGFLKHGSLRKQADEDQCPHCGDDGGPVIGHDPLLKRDIYACQGCGKAFVGLGGDDEIALRDSKHFLGAPTLERMSARGLVRHEVPASEVQEGDFLDIMGKVRVHQTMTRGDRTTLAWRQRGSKAPGIRHHDADEPVKVWRKVEPEQEVTALLRHFASEDYRIQHTAPDAEEGASFHDPSNILPDVHAHPEYYASPHYTGSYESWAALSRAKGKPDLSVSVYRAVPHGVRQINPGDWVTPSKEYAKLHGIDSCPGCGGNMQIVHAKIKAKDLHGAGDITEWGYTGEHVKEHLGSPLRLSCPKSKKTSSLVGKGQAFWAKPAGEYPFKDPDPAKEHQPYVGMVDFKHGPFHMTRDPQTREHHLVDNANRRLGSVPGSDGSNSEHYDATGVVADSWHELNQAGGFHPKSTKHSDEWYEAEKSPAKPPFEHSDTDPRQAEYEARPKPRVAEPGPMGSGGSDEWHGPYEVVQHPETKKFHVVDGNGGHPSAWPGPRREGYDSQTEAEVSRDHTDRRMQSKEKVKGIVDKLWNDTHEIVDPGGTDESRRTERHTDRLNELGHRYQGGPQHPLHPGRFGADDYEKDGDGEGQPFYEVKDPAGSGWTAKDYGGDKVHIGHESTPGQDHDVTYPEGGTEGGWSGPGTKRPGFGHDDLHQELHHWIHGDGTEEDPGQGKDYAEHADPRIKRWQQRNGYKG